MQKIIFSVIALILFGLNLKAHPASGIVVDKLGNVYFVYTGKGVAKISHEGVMTYVSKSVDGHWLCLDEKGIFSNSQPKYFNRITPNGTKPALIFAGGGSPIMIHRDGKFYYCGSEQGNMHPGALSLIQETPDNHLTLFGPELENNLKKLHDGIMGLASGSDNSIYISCWNSLLKIGMDGRIIKIVHPVEVTDCDEDPADHKETNRGLPLLRGIDADSIGNVYLAATSCHCLIKMNPDGRIQTILKAERPWTPTGVAVRNGNIYVLEYTNANGPAKEGWFPRVRKIDKNGNISLLIDLSKDSVKSTH